MVQRSRRRAEWYHSAEEFAGLLKTRRQFARWPDGVHDLFARATLRREPETGLWHLACPRDYEAHIFDTNRDPTVWPRMLEGLAVPIAIIGADPELATHEGPALVCRALAEAAGLDYQNVPGTTHLLQLEEPRPARLLSSARSPGPALSIGQACNGARHAKSSSGRFRGLNGWADLAHRRPAFRALWTSLRPPCGRQSPRGTRALPVDPKTRSKRFRKRMKGSSRHTHYGAFDDRDGRCLPLRRRATVGKPGNRAGPAM